MRMLFFYKTAGMLKLQSTKIVAQNRSLGKRLVQEYTCSPDYKLRSFDFFLNCHINEKAEEMHVFSSTVFKS